PIAAGQVSIPAALGLATILALFSLGIAWKLHASLTWVILLYGVIQVVYCLWLKQQPLLDLFCIASGFLLRAMAGVVASNLGFSPWFLLTIGLLALFLAIEKRKA
ncbi:MAG: UbiA family prenyltransferase, partial [bacterium]